MAIKRLRFPAGHYYRTKVAMSSPRAIRSLQVRSIVTIGTISRPVELGSRSANVDTGAARVVQGFPRLAGPAQSAMHLDALTPSSQLRALHERSLLQSLGD